MTWAPRIKNQKRITRLPCLQFLDRQGKHGRSIPVQELSIVSAPYEVGGQVVGTLGVVGPTRMAYDLMIQFVDITSKLVSNALSHNK